MFLANGDFDGKLKKTETIEGFTNSIDLFGVGETPNVSDEDIINCQDILVKDEKNLDKIKSLEIGSLFHKKIRDVIRPILKPGLKLSELAESIEGTCMSLTKGLGINKGIGFPSSLSVNECAAHFTPCKAHDITLDENSITKIDFGVEINGWITDCAFTIAFNDQYINLLNAVKEATYHGIKTVAIDQDIGEWGEGIREVMESYEVTVNNKTYPVKSIKNLGGHSILQGQIHGGTFLPSFNISKSMFSYKRKFTENVYAVETFGSLGRENVIEVLNENSIYMKNYRSGESDSSMRSKLPEKYVKVFDILNSTFKTMPFCDRYLETMNVFSNLKLDNPKHLKKFKTSTMNVFGNSGIYTPYPPLYSDAMTAQYEHTIYLSENKKIIFSQSSDY